MNENKDRVAEEDFIILSDTEPAGLANKVNRKLDERYELHGSPFVFKDSICQAMTFGKISRKLDEPRWPA